MSSRAFLSCRAFQPASLIRGRKHGFAPTGLASLLLALFALGCERGHVPVINVHFPIGPADVRIPAVQATYVLGNVQPPGSHLTINGRAVDVHRRGGFLAYVPVEPGRFTIRFEAKNDAGKTVVERYLDVAKDPHEAQVDGSIVLESVEPTADLERRAGDTITVRTQSAPGLSGNFDIVGVRTGIPLVEVTPRVYEGTYTIGVQDRATRSVIRLRLGSPGRRAEVEAAGRLTIALGPPAVAVFSRDDYDSTFLRAAPRGKPMMELANGVGALATGRTGEEARIRLSDTLSGWAPIEQLRFLPASTPPLRSALRGVLITPSERSSLVVIELSEPVPYRIEHVGDTFRVSLFYTDERLGDCLSRDGRVLRVRCSHASGGGSVDVELHLSPSVPLWGFDVASARHGLEVELRWPPPIPRNGSALSGAVVILDPGHSPSDSGRVGPLGIPERTHNLRLARRLEALLEDEGAKVVMTRRSDGEEVSLEERLKIAWSARGDALISLHNNSLAHGIDPFAEPHGFSVFYHHPYSLTLAKNIHRAYQLHVPLADEGLVHNDFFVTMTTKMPSVLVESAYFIFPEQEELLLNRRFQSTLAKALLEGLRETFRSSGANL